MSRVWGLGCGVQGLGFRGDQKESSRVFVFHVTPILNFFSGFH